MRLGNVIPDFDKVANVQHSSSQAYVDYVDAIKMGLGGIIMQRRYIELETVLALASRHGVEDATERGVLDELSRKGRRVLCLPLSKLFADPAFQRRGTEVCAVRQ
jgi:hypothetical protein